MSREAFGDPPESQEPPDLCPVCGNDWHAEDCEFGKEVARRLKAERDAHKLAYAMENVAMMLRKCAHRLNVNGHEDLGADAVGLLRRFDLLGSPLRKAEPVLALTNLANSKTPNKPLRRGVDGVCTRSTCECERDGLGDQCVWLKPAEAEFECLGEPSLCENPRGCACAPDPTLKPDIAALKKRLAEDPGFAAEVTGDRPPTPVGWSDTDWLKHLEEIRQDQEVYHRGPLPETGWD